MTDKEKQIREEIKDILRRNGYLTFGSMVVKKSKDNSNGYSVGGFSIVKESE